MGRMVTLWNNWGWMTPLVDQMQAMIGFVESRFCKSALLIAKSRANYIVLLSFLVPCRLGLSEILRLIYLQF